MLLWPHFVACLIQQSQQAPDVYVTSGWRWTWRQTNVAFWLKMKIGLTSIWRWLNVGFWLHNLKTTKSQHQLTSVLDINLTLTLDIGFTLDFGHPTSQPKFNQISTSYDVVCLFCACWEVPSSFHHRKMCQRVYSHLSCLVQLNQTQLCFPPFCGSFGKMLQPYWDPAEEVVSVRFQTNSGMVTWMNQWMDDLSTRVVLFTISGPLVKRAAWKRTTQSMNQ